jgi:hypothetical protein
MVKHVHGFIVASSSAWCCATARISTLEVPSSSIGSRGQGAR